MWNRKILQPSLIKGVPLPLEFDAKAGLNNGALKRMDTPKWDQGSVCRAWVPRSEALAAIRRKPTTSTSQAQMNSAAQKLQKVIKELAPCHLVLGGERRPNGAGERASLTRMLVFQLLKMFSPVGFRGNRFHWEYVFTFFRGLEQMEVVNAHPVQPVKQLVDVCCACWPGRSCGLGL